VHVPRRTPSSLAARRRPRLRRHRRPRSRRRRSWRCPGARAEWQPRRRRGGPGGRRSGGEADRWRRQRGDSGAVGWALPATGVHSMRAGRARPLRAADMKKDVRILLVGERESARQSPPAAPFFLVSLEASQPLRSFSPFLCQLAALILSVHPDLPAPSLPGPRTPLKPRPHSPCRQAASLRRSSPPSPCLPGLIAPRGRLLPTLSCRGESPVSHGQTDVGTSRLTNRGCGTGSGREGRRGRSAERVHCAQGQVYRLGRWFSLSLCICIKRECWGWG
jgi:hypothetical protein